MSPPPRKRHFSSRGHLRQQWLLRIGSGGSGGLALPHPPLFKCTGNLFGILM